MIRYRLLERISDWQFQHGRTLQLKELAEKTGIHRTTLSRMINKRGYKVNVENIDRLCQFFGCRVDELMEHVPDPQEAPKE